MNNMNSSEMTQAKIIFSMMLEDEERARDLLIRDKLNIHKAAKLIVINYLNGTLEDLDFDIYSDAVKVAYSAFLKTQYDRKPIHGDFYPELRQRYYDILNVQPIENSDEPLQDTHIAWMLTKLSSDDMSETKKHRWLGFIQGCMAYRGLLTVNDERNATRDIFKGK